MIRAFDDFCIEAGEDLGKFGIEKRPLIRAVGEQFLQEWEHSKQRGWEHNAAVAILDVGRMHNSVE